MPAVRGRGHRLRARGLHARREAGACRTPGLSGRVGASERGRGGPRRAVDASARRRDPGPVSLRPDVVDASPTHPRCGALLWPILYSDIRLGGFRGRDRCCSFSLSPALACGRLVDMADDAAPPACKLGVDESGAAGREEGEPRRGRAFSIYRRPVFAGPVLGHRNCPIVFQVQSIRRGVALVRGPRSVAPRWCAASPGRRSACATCRSATWLQSPTWTPAC